MSSLARQEIRELCCGRLGRLDSQARPKWGRMSAPEMVCHLNDSFGAACGEKAVSGARGVVPGWLMKFGALRLPMRWPPGVKTRPEIEQGRGGTPPGVWEQDCAKLREWILTFHAREGLGPHPIFGAMTAEDWQIWGYRHVDHHLRQFGV